MWKIRKKEKRASRSVWTTIQRCGIVSKCLSPLSLPDRIDGVYDKLHGRRTAARVATLVSSVSVCTCYPSFWCLWGPQSMHVILRLLPGSSLLTQPCLATCVQEKDGGRDVSASTVPDHSQAVRRTLCKCMQRMFVVQALDFSLSQCRHQVGPLCLHCCAGRSDRLSDRGSVLYWRNCLLVPHQH